MERQQTEQAFERSGTPPWFTGVYFPARKAEILRAATANHAGSDIIEQVGKIADREYFNIEDVLEELERSAV